MLSVVRSNDCVDCGLAIFEDRIWDKILFKQITVTTSEKGLVYSQLVWLIGLDAWKGKIEKMCAWPEAYKVFTKDQACTVPQSLGSCTAAVFMTFENLPPWIRGLQRLFPLSHGEWTSLRKMTCQYPLLAYHAWMLQPVFKELALHFYPYNEALKIWVIWVWGKAERVSSVLEQGLQHSSMMNKPGILAVHLPQACPFLMTKGEKPLGRPQFSAPTFAVLSRPSKIMIHHHLYSNVQLLQGMQVVRQRLTHLTGIDLKSLCQKYSCHRTTMHNASQWNPWDMLYRHAYVSSLAWVNLCIQEESQHSPPLGESARQIAIYSN